MNTDITNIAMMWFAIITITICCWVVSFLVACHVGESFWSTAKEDARTSLLLFFWPVGVIYIVIRLMCLICLMFKCFFSKGEIQK